MADILQWMYNSRTGAVIEAPSPAAALLLRAGIGWHGPFDSKEKALAYYSDNKAKNPGWTAPTSLVGTLGNIPKAAGGTVEAAKNTLGLGDADLRAWFIRIGEVLLGIVLVGVGVAKLTGTTNVVSNLVKARI